MAEEYRREAHKRWLEMNGWRGGGIELFLL